ncbi:ATP-binding protein [Marinobacteraceae bacterium S3BR75-40.1]
MIPKAPTTTLQGMADSRGLQMARLFRVYNQYRIVISLFLFGLLFVEFDAIPLKYRYPLFYQATTLVYLGMNLFIGLLLLTGSQARPRQISISILIDLIALHALLLFSAGPNSGLANLIIVSVAAGNILVPSRIGFFFAALAALCSLGTAIWGLLRGFDAADVIVQAGLLGILYFAVAFILQSITRRMIYSETLANQRARSIIELEKLNHQIIQQMRTGILVCDRQGIVRMANAAAGELLLGSKEGADRLSMLPPPLKERLEKWLHDPWQRTAPFQTQSNTPRIQANFTPLDEVEEDLYLVFLEDTGKLMQQAQQMKLASLGRLTAGIAHEIRNPLGAISHAAQLLDEAPNLESGERRLIEIVRRHSKRVNHIIENVLQLSRRRPASTEQHALNPWLRELVDNYCQGRSEDCRITLELTEHEALARFDASQMEQVLTNLIENGLRYSFQATGEYRLTVRTGVTEDSGRAYIDIHDEGPGVPEDHRDSIFEPFFTTEQSGTGLGLYLARELCEANQAHLNLAEDQGGGCCFRITFAHQGRLDV